MKKTGIQEIFLKLQNIVSNSLPCSVQLPQGLDPELEVRQEWTLEVRLQLEASQVAQAPWEALDRVDPTLEGASAGPDDLASLVTP